MMIEETNLITEMSHTIKAIDQKTVHRICSGQVVLNLATAVKELIENAIDAGATKINVRLKEYGSEFVEVADNGCGVKSENFQGLTLKHYTSKIQEFSDLESIQTLGFRGEALSSLCALSDLTIITRHNSVDCATKIVYDHNGKIISEAPTAREEGTTVILSNLFSTLPVRKKEFLKNLKREFNKMCQLLYAYCLVCKNVKFSCTNQTKTINNVVTTEGANTTRENIISIFGIKQLSTLIDIELSPPDEAILNEYELPVVPSEDLPFSFEFIISSVTHGHGRSTTDRQFCYINYRPCDLSKVMKLVNDVYRQFNNNQYPFVYLNILTEKNQVDVNVTPDKRQIFVAKEKLLLATIKASLLQAFQVFPSTLKVQNVGIVKHDCENSKSINGNTRAFKRSVSEETPTLKHYSIKELFHKRPKIEENALASMPIKRAAIIDSSIKNENVLTCKLRNISETKTKTVNEGLTLLQKGKDVSKNDCITREEEKQTNIDILLETVNNESHNMDVDNTTINTFIELDQEIEKVNRTITTLDVSLEKIRSALTNTELTSNKKNYNVQFHSKISPDTNERAEKELQKQISKEMFKKMSIVGQFNHGFIITKLDSDLFIVDQHATDEKYNFEQLQATTTLERQVLVKPKPLELTAANKSVLIENEEIFRKNGFTFKINDDGECTKKVFLTGIPMSKNYIFGKDDIDEMLFMLQDGSNIMCRPSRIRSMFASRACRKSVMVGDPLSQSDMRKLIDHMGEIEQPWNCPHGRPTIRHLINLDLILEN